MKKLFSVTLMIALFAIHTFSQNSKQENYISGQTEKQEINWRHSIGSSIFLLGNIGDSVNFAQLNYGYQLTHKDLITAEVITWTYYEPLGTFGSSEKFYPGKVRAYGIGLGYQRFLWKKLYATVEPTFFLQQFYDTDNEKIQKGFQLYLQFIVGYRIEFFKKRMFIEPALALKYWPVNTNFPASFAVIESGKPKYIFEPGLNIGVKF